ncbi:helix-turn-helix domain-containing protein [Streptomonospora wellingtoniae]|uniref:Helix-turn-helix transcriptional regulator n=1 Tax=Streptomonospora wellingtoniae TaxID=3075544 RepID=A0ABU2KUI7_9ACTN|nr:helix-turn-helix transcriptional regulator [Streptomonospora sp. DSM 45055]MDT0302965.1 helix-turn-helix transcriptional regulator [Streptomonospora sp. DSM 45055]
MPKTTTVRANGAAIQALREKDGYSLAELSRRAGLRSHTHLMYIERGEKPVSVRTLNRIAQALAVPAAAILLDPIGDEAPDAEEVAS